MGNIEQARERMRQHLERVAEEESAWRAARLHEALHGNWLEPDECATCIYEAEINREGQPEFNGAFR
jgi:hypothetical protein